MRLSQYLRSYIHHDVFGQNLVSAFHYHIDEFTAGKEKRMNGEHVTLYI